MSTLPIRPPPVPPPRLTSSPTAPCRWSMASIQTAAPPTATPDATPITGSGFSGTTPTVKFGGRAASSDYEVQVVSDSTISNLWQPGRYGHRGRHRDHTGRQARPLPGRSVHLLRLTRGRRRRCAGQRPGCRWQRRDDHRRRLQRHHPHGGVMHRGGYRCRGGLRYQDHLHEPRRRPDRGCHCGHAGGDTSAVCRQVHLPARTGDRRLLDLGRTPCPKATTSTRWLSPAPRTAGRWARATPYCAPPTAALTGARRARAPR